MIMAPQTNISEPYLKRLATVYDNQDVASQTIREMASELLSLRQQIGQHAKAEEATRKANVYLQDLLDQALDTIRKLEGREQAPAVEPAQAVPDGYCLMPREPTQWMRVQIECGIESNSVADVWGRLIRAVDLENKHRQSRERNALAIDDETRKRVLELCSWLETTNAFIPLPFYNRITTTVKKLKEKLGAE